MKNDGMPVDFYEYEGGYHVFEMVVPNADISQIAAARLLAAYKYASEHYFVAQN